jgi:hypothetical protein
LDFLIKLLIDLVLNLIKAKDLNLIELLKILFVRQLGMFLFNQSLALLIAFVRIDFCVYTLKKRTKKVIKT